MKTNTLKTLLCLLFMGVAMHPCRAEEPVEPCEEPPCNTEEPHVYLPLFGEYETSYNILFGYNSFYEARTFSAYYTGEQIIDGENYKVFNDNSSFRIVEDNSKVYYYDPEFAEDVLVFDLNLEEGDIFVYYYYYYNVYTNVVTRETRDFIVNSVYVDKKGRKNVLLISKNENLGDHFPYLKFIEGEGSSASIFSSANLFWKEFFFCLCSWKDGEQTYFFHEDSRDIYERFCIADKNNNVPPYFCELFDYSSCEVTIVHGNIDKSSIGNYRFYPNPARDRVTIEAESALIPTNAIVEIVDVTGCICLQKSMEEFPLELSVKSLVKGVYILRILSGGQQLYSNTLLIE